MHLRQNHDGTPSSTKDVDWIVLAANAIGIVVVVLASFQANPVKTAANDDSFLVTSNTF